MTPQAVVSHASKGRLRVRIPSKRRHAGFFKDLKKVLEHVDRIEAVSANPELGSLLILGELSVDEIFSIAEKKHLFVKRKAARQDTFLKDLLNLIRDTDEALKEASGGKLDVGTVTFGTLLGLGLYQVWKGDVLASASSLLVGALGYIRFTV